MNIQFEISREPMPTKTMIRFSKYGELVDAVMGLKKDEVVKLNTLAYEDARTIVSNVRQFLYKDGLRLTARTIKNGKSCFLYMKLK